MITEGNFCLLISLFVLIVSFCPRALCEICLDQRRAVPSVYITLSGSCSCNEQVDAASWLVSPSVSQVTPRGGISQVTAEHFRNWCLGRDRREATVSCAVSSLKTPLCLGLSLYSSFRLKHRVSECGGGGSKTAASRLLPPLAVLFANS